MSISSSWVRAKRAEPWRGLRNARSQLDPAQALAENDAYPFFRNLRDLVIAGPTGANVMDLRLIIVRWIASSTVAEFHRPTDAEQRHDETTETIQSVMHTLILSLLRCDSHHNRDKQRKQKSGFKMRETDLRHCS